MTRKEILENSIVFDPFKTDHHTQAIDSLEDLDATVALEDALIEKLGAFADVDGHDVGSGETNIFIYTSDPAATFRQTKPVLERRQQLQSVTAATAMLMVRSSP